MKEKSVLGLLLGLLSYIVGSINMVTIAFFIFMAIDFLTGVIGSKSNDESYSKEIAWKGAWKKLGYVILWFISVIIELVIHEQGATLGFDVKVPVSLFITFYLLGTEGLSIMQNLHRMGVKVPKWFADYFNKMQKAADKDEQ